MLGPEEEQAPAPRRNRTGETRILTDYPLTCRHLLQDAAVLGGVAGLEALLPGYARGRPVAGPALGADGAVDLLVGETAFRLGGRQATAITVNGTVPGPLIRLRQGQEEVIRVANRLGEDT